MVCHLETIYYSVVMEDASTHRNITTEGQTDFRGHDVRITTGRLEQNRTYRVYVKARALQVEEWHVLDQLDLGKKPMDKEHSNNDIKLMWCILFKLNSTDMSSTDKNLGKTAY